MFTSSTDNSKKGSLVAWNTLHMLTGQSAKLAIQAVYFILMARSLGPHQYGAFVAVTAAAAIVSPFVGNGTGILMIKNVSRDRSLFAEYLGNALLVSLVSGAVLAVGVAVGCLLFLPSTIPTVVIVQLVIAEVILGRLIEVPCWAFQSVELMGWTASINVFATFMRLVGIVAIVLMHRPTLLAWSIAYVVTVTISAVAGVACVLWRLGKPRLALHRIPGELREGFYFSSGQSAQTIYNDIDKTMLARLGTFGATGIYAAAYRLIDVSFIPVRSLLAAAYPGFFRSGRRGIAASLAYAKRLLMRAFWYSVVVSAALWIAAPLAPVFLGAQYSSTTQALRWLALLPLLKTVHYFAADSLTGAGYQGMRTLVQVIVALFNIGINFWIIPACSWRGAAWSSLASDGLLALSLWCCVAIVRTKVEAFRPGSEEAAEAC
jgi:O-antigen/teichoic acid export membrane protein